MAAGQGKKVPARRCGKGNEAKPSLGQISQSMRPLECVPDISRRCWKLHIQAINQQPSWGFQGNRVPHGLVGGHIGFPGRTPNIFTQPEGYADRCVTCHAMAPPGHLPDGELRRRFALLPCASRPPRRRPRPRYWQKPAAMPRQEQQLRRCRARHDTRQMRRAAQRQKRCRRG